MPSSLSRTACPARTMKLWKWILLFVGGFIGFLILYSIGEGLGLAPYSKVLKCLIYILFSIITLLVYRFSVRLFEKRKVTELTLSRFFPDLGKGLGIGALYFTLVAASMMIAGSYSIKSYNHNLAQMILPLCNYFLVAVSEEVIFRGVMFRLIAQRWNTVIALVVSALFFGVVHIFNPGASWWSSLAIAIEAGLLLGAAYMYTDNLWCPIGIHWAWNFIQGNVLGFAVSGTNSGEALFTPSIGGPDILSGGSFGAEASILAVVIGLGISIYFLINTNKKRA